VDDILVWGRVIERLLITLCGGLSLVLGWHLFKIGVVNEQAAELTKADASVRLQKVGPGVFFALFGTAVLLYSLFNDLQLQQGELQQGAGEASSVSYFNNLSEQGERRLVAALNTVINSFALPVEEIPDADLRDVDAAVPELETLRRGILVSRFGRTNVDLWIRRGDDYLMNQQSVSSEERDVLEQMRPWWTERLRGSD
jgi:hypothetical protein